MKMMPHRLELVKRQADEIRDDLVGGRLYGLTIHEDDHDMQLVALRHQMKLKEAEAETRGRLHMINLMRYKPRKGRVFLWACILAAAQVAIVGTMIALVTMFGVMS